MATINDETQQNGVANAASNGVQLSYWQERKTQIDWTNPRAKELAELCDAFDRWEKEDESMSQEEIDAEIDALRAIHNRRNRERFAITTGDKP